MKKLLKLMILSLLMIIAVVGAMGSTAFAEAMIDLPIFDTGIVVSVPADTVYEDNQGGLYTYTSDSTEFLFGLAELSGVTTNIEARKALMNDGYTTSLVTINGISAVRGQKQTKGSFLTTTNLAYVFSHDDTFYIFTGMAMLSSQVNEFESNIAPSLRYVPDSTTKDCQIFSSNVVIKIPTDFTKTSPYSSSETWESGNIDLSMTIQKEASYSYKTLEEYKDYLPR